MLTEISISNLITIQELHLDFTQGTTVITGETGAGKSILIDAIELALGARAAPEMVRSGQDKADISLCFDITDSPEARAWLTTYELSSGTSECIIRRTITKDGRSRSYINNMPVTLQPLREFSGFLMNIHGQHEHQALLKSETQRAMLDRFGGHELLLDQVRALSDEWHVLSKEISDTKKRAAERNQRSQLLKFQLTEFETLNLTPNEFETLDQEHKQLAHSDELLQNMNQVSNILSAQDEFNVLQSLQTIVQSLEPLQKIEPKIAGWLESLNNAMIQLTDVEEEVERYLGRVESDPARLVAVEQRLSLLFDTARKHKVAPLELYHLQQSLLKEFKELETTDERLAELEIHLDQLEKHYHEVAHKLSQSRLKTAKKLATQVTNTIHELALPEGEFHVFFEMEDFSHPLPNGMEKVIFEIKTNAGQDHQPLAKVASGGELSRISLAIHLATAERHTIPTLIFDEVDVGIGGGTAEIVGKLLRRLGTSHQVLCITHSPQVAAQGHHHLRVKKMSENNMTTTSIHSLVETDKINEIARMLGGVEMTQKTIEHAQEMLEKVTNPKNAGGSPAMA